MINLKNGLVYLDFVNNITGLVLDVLKLCVNGRLYIINLVLKHLDRLFSKAAYLNRLTYTIDKVVDFAFDRRVSTVNIRFLLFSNCKILIDFCQSKDGFVGGNSMIENSLMCKIDVCECEE